MWPRPPQGCREAKPMEFQHPEEDAANSGIFSQENPQIPKHHFPLAQRSCGCQMLGMPELGWDLEQPGIAGSAHRNPRMGFNVSSHPKHSRILGFTVENCGKRIKFARQEDGNLLSRSFYNSGENSKQEKGLEFIYLFIYLFPLRASALESLEFRAGKTTDFLDGEEGFGILRWDGSCSGTGSIPGGANIPSGKERSPFPDGMRRSGRGKGGNGSSRGSTPGLSGSFLPQEFSGNGNFPRKLWM